MKTVMGSTTDLKQMFALGDLGLMIKDLPTAEEAYKRAALMPGGEERARRGLGLVAKQKEVARQDLTMADDPPKKAQIKSSLDKYRAAIYENPRVPEARLGYAVVLQKDKPEKASNLKQAITQYKALLDLETELPQKEAKRISRRIAALQERAYKLSQREKGYC